MAGSLEGKNVGPYRVLGELGRGAMGVVLRARSPSGKDVAIKVLLEESAADPERRGRFEREQRLLEELGEGFVPLIDTGEDGGRPYIVMPFVSGGTLRDRIRSGPLDLDDAISLGRELARTIARAHEKGIIHRDLKPENVLFDADGRALIADLGLGKHLVPRSPQSGELSRSGEARGTFGYMPLEQVENAKAADARSDVFSLAAILYECLSGKQAFPGKDVVSVIDRLMKGEVEPLASLRPDVPPWLAAAIESALSSDRDERPADGAAFARLLEPAAPPRRSSAGVAIAGLLATIAVGGFIAWRLRSAPKQTTTPPEGPRATTPPAPPAAPTTPPPPSVTPPAPPPAPAPPARWRNRAAMPEPRMKLAAATAPDGAIHVVGGRGGKGTAARHDVYDPARDAWSTRAPLPAPRAQHAATFVGDKLYVAGGSVTANKPRAEVFEWDPGSDRWRELAPLPSPRQNLALVAHEGKLWAIGGAGVESEEIDHASLYDPATGRWLDGPKHPAKLGPSVAVSLGEHVVVVADDLVLIASPGQAAFRETRLEKPQLALGGSAGGLVGDRLILAAGRRPEGPVPLAVSIDATTVATAKLIALGSLPPLTAARRSHAAASAGGKLYVFGGMNVTENGALDSVEELGP